MLVKLFFSFRQVRQVELLPEPLPKLTFHVLLCTFVGQWQSFLEESVATGGGQWGHGQLHAEKQNNTKQNILDEVMWASTVPNQWILSGDTIN